MRTERRVAVISPLLNLLAAEYTLTVETTTVRTGLDLSAVVNAMSVCIRNSIAEAAPDLIANRLYRETGHNWVAALCR